MAGVDTSAPGAGRTIMVAFHEPHLGGAVLSALRTVPHLEERGWRFSFWVPRPSPLFDRLESEGREVRGAPRHVGFSLAALRLPPGPRARLAGLPRYLRAFRARVREVEPAVVHANAVLTLPEALAARSRGVPTVLHVHEMVAESAKGRIAARAAALVSSEQVAVSRACAARLRGRPRIVFEGAPVPAEAPERSGRDGRPLRVGTVGVISQRKGSDLFVEAAALVGKSAPDVRFQMIGSPTDPLDAEWAEGVLARAREVGVEHLPSADVPRALAEWDLFALPSRRDPCPIALLEAMASGLPVVGARTDGIPEEIGPGTGLVVEPDSPRALADAILELRATPAERRGEMGTAGRRRVQAEFSIERQAQGLHEAYLAAIGEGG